MDEKLEELAKVIRESGAYALKGTTTNKLAEIILAAGYAKRSDTKEECAKVAYAHRAYTWGNEAPGINAYADGANDMATKIETAIRALKENL